MLLKDLKIAFALTGSYCVFDKVIPQVEILKKEGADVFPVVSYEVAKTDTRFGRAQDFINRLDSITGKKTITSMQDVEPMGVVYPIDLVVISPCTGNSLSKLANAATDTPVLMAAKGAFRNHKPVVIGVATNDGLGMCAKNIGSLLTSKNVFFVPFGQDNYKIKPDSLVSKFELTLPTVLEALKGKQIQPVFEKF
ncbi:MAG: dipicolinate synthase subunit B [Clostridiaceae bacterium]|nr:dipicolinate synthase subunit B [Clostridiaceae bacterium]